MEGWPRSSKTGMDTRQPIMSGNNREAPWDSSPTRTPQTGRIPGTGIVGNDSMILMNYRRWTDEGEWRRKARVEEGLRAWFHEMTNILWRRSTPEINQYFSAYNSAVQSVTLTKWTSGVRIPVRRLQDCAVHGYFVLYFQNKKQTYRVRLFFLFCLKKWCERVIDLTADYLFLEHHFYGLSYDHSRVWLGSGPYFTLPVYFNG